MNTKLILSVVIVSAVAVMAFAAYRIANSSGDVSTTTGIRAASLPEPSADRSSTHVPIPPVDVARSSELEQPFDPNVARRITADEAATLLEKGEKVVFVDVRREIDGPMIAGAKHVSVEDAKAWSRKYPKSTWIIAYCTCSNESTSSDFVLELQRNGFRNSFALFDGLAGWELRNLPTEVRIGKPGDRTS